MACWLSLCRVLAAVILLASSTGANWQRRAGTASLEYTYSVNCYGANSSFAIPECNCLGGTPDPRLSGRDKIRIVVGSWFAAAMDAFLLKVAIEEVLGFPVELVPDGINTNPSKLTGPKSVYDALATGSVHIYPEVRACEPASLQACKPNLRCARAKWSPDQHFRVLQVWLSEERDLYQTYVREKGTVRTPVGMRSKLAIRRRLCRFLCRSSP